MIGRADLAREGLVRILAENSFEVIASVGEVDELDPRLGDDPFLIVIDGSTRDHAAERIGAACARFPHARVIALADIFDLGCLQQVFSASGHGYIVRQCSCDTLIASLKLAHTGAKIVPPEIADSICAGEMEWGGEAGRHIDPNVLLSERENEILKCLLEGLPNKLISRKLAISEATVKVHVKAVFRKLKVSNRTQAAMWAANNNMANEVVTHAERDAGRQTAFAFNRDFDLIDLSLHETPEPAFGVARPGAAVAWSTGISSKN